MNCSLAEHETNCSSESAAPDSQGFNNADIAAKLYLSENTVRNNVSVILPKPGVSDCTRVALMAIRHGL
jgi:DNA-binding NarL/FixJ family response regulator